MIYRTPIGSFPFKTQHLKFSLGHSQQSPGYLAGWDNCLLAILRLLGFGLSGKSFRIISGLVWPYPGTWTLFRSDEVLGQWKGKACCFSKMEDLIQIEIFTIF